MHFDATLRYKKQTILTNFSDKKSKKGLLKCLVQLLLLEKNAVLRLSNFLILITSMLCVIDLKSDFVVVVVAVVVFVAVVDDAVAAVFFVLDAELLSK